MKKSTLFLAVALLATIGFYSCENENNSLRGTTWFSTTVLNYDAKMKIKFYDKTNCETIGVDEYLIEEELTDIPQHFWAKIKYTYNNPNISIIFDNKTTWKGRVNGNEMILSMFDKDVTFIKQ